MLQIRFFLHEKMLESGEIYEIKMLKSCESLRISSLSVYQVRLVNAMLKNRQQTDKLILIIILIIIT